jgi:putative transcriptional regulator
MKKPQNRELRVANKLREMRFHNCEMTQEELASKLDVSRQTVIAIENGRFNPSIMLALKAARFFGCRVEDIFTLAEVEK